mmetsp:Transcript_9177/g.30226  ORF Transcript_9177/g.30226 Transcript_9177/m.30226 type:complete len:250 (+) Transcript_9177:1009-1758(+)
MVLIRGDFGPAVVCAGPGSRGPQEHRRRRVNVSLAVTQKGSERAPLEHDPRLRRHRNRERRHTLLRHHLLHALHELLGRGNLTRGRVVERRLHLLLQKLDRAEEGARLPLREEQAFERDYARRLRERFGVELLDVLPERRLALDEGARLRHRRVGIHRILLAVVVAAGAREESLERREVLLRRLWQRTELTLQLEAVVDAPQKVPKHDASCIYLRGLQLWDADSGVAERRLLPSQDAAEMLLDHLERLL